MTQMNRRKFFGFLGKGAAVVASVVGLPELDGNDNELPVGISDDSQEETARGAKSWSELGTSANDVHALAIAPDGHIYIGGTFTQASGVSIAMYDGTSWAPIPISNSIG